MLVRKSDLVALGRFNLLELAKETVNSELKHLANSFSKPIPQNEFKKKQRITNSFRNRETF